jgi:protein SCO1/2
MLNKQNYRYMIVTCFVVVMGVTAGWPARASGQTSTQPAVELDRKESVPQELQGVDIEDKRGARVPLELRFVDSLKRAGTLRQYFPGDRPVILNLGYFRCPMLCGLVTNGLLEGMKELDWNPGEEFEVLTISIDHKETPELARLKKQGYMQEYGRAAAAQGWHFLTGDKEDIELLAQTVGFKYRYDPETQQYAHAAGIVVLTPSGKVSRYLYGIEYPAKDLRLALLEASEGKIGSLADRVLLSCFKYDPERRRYTLAATNLMRFGGGLTVVILAAILIPKWIRDNRRKKQASPA